MNQPNILLLYLQNKQKIITKPIIKLLWIKCFYLNDKDIQWRYNVIMTYHNCIGVGWYIFVHYHLLEPLPQITLMYTQSKNPRHYGPRSDFRFQSAMAKLLKWKPLLSSMGSLRNNIVFLKISCADWGTRFPLPKISHSILWILNTVLSWRVLWCLMQFLSQYT
jgi:hypothetical protein